MEICLDFNTPLTGVAQAEGVSNPALPPVSPPLQAQRVSHATHPTFYFLFPSPALCNLISAAGMWFFCGLGLQSKPVRKIPAFHKTPR